MLKKGENLYIPPGNVVVFNGISPCIPFIAHRQSEKDAYVGHFLDPRKGLKEMIENAIKKFRNPNLSDVYVTGSSIISKDFFDYDMLMMELERIGQESGEMMVSGKGNHEHLIKQIKQPISDEKIFKEIYEGIKELQTENREFVTSMIKKYGFNEKKVFVKWSPPASNTELRFNVDDGSSTLKINSEEGKIIYEGDIRKAPVSEDGVVLVP
ncbi:MAG: hypothetical protein V3U72_03245 [Candidatus Aenigmarchaeota archaeon]